MRIRRLELYGFKSFPDRTVFTFGDGVSCVVGPNGCGKSNVLDAIRWCVGEQSPRNLRGGSMSDVIFTGSSERRPVGFAEVRLTLEAAGQAFAGALVHLDEVTVARRLHKDGSNEYFLNQVRCRRKDVTDLFLDTGVGSSLYSFIEQGQVDRIVNATPAERRALIDEAAGISRYKHRREEAHQKLVATASQLDRAADLADEMGRRLRTLEQQGLAAARFRRLSALVAQDEMWLALAKYGALAADRKALGERQREREHALAAMDRDLKRRAIDIEARRAELREAAASLEVERAALAEVDAAERALTSAAEQRERHLRDLEARLEATHKALERGEADVRDLEAKRVVVQSRVRSLEADIGAVVVEADSGAVGHMRAAYEEAVRRSTAAVEAARRAHTNAEALAARADQVEALSAAEGLAPEGPVVDLAAAVESARDATDRAVAAAHAADAARAELQMAEAAVAKLAERQRALTAEQAERANTLRIDESRLAERRENALKKLDRAVRVEEERRVASLREASDVRERSIRDLWDRVDAARAEIGRIDAELAEGAPEGFAAIVPDQGRYAVPVDVPWAAALLGDLADAPVVSADDVETLVRSGVDGIALLEGQRNALLAIRTVDGAADLVAHWEPGSAVALTGDAVVLDARGALVVCRDAAEGLRRGSERRAALLARREALAAEVEAQVGATRQGALRAVREELRVGEQGIRDELRQLAQLANDLTVEATTLPVAEVREVAVELRAWAHTVGADRLRHEDEERAHRERLASVERDVVVATKALADARQRCTELERAAVGLQRDATGAESAVQVARRHLELHEQARREQDRRKSALEAQRTELALSLARARDEERRARDVAKDAEVARQTAHEGWQIAAEHQREADRRRQEAALLLATLRERRDAAVLEASRLEETHAEAARRRADLDRDRGQIDARVSELKLAQSADGAALARVAVRREEAVQRNRSQQDRFEALRAEIASTEEGQQSAAAARAEAADALATARAASESTRADLEILRREVEHRYHMSLPALLDRMDASGFVALGNAVPEWVVGPEPVEAVTPRHLTPSMLDDAEALAEATDRLARHRDQLESITEVHMSSLAEHEEVARRYRELDEQREDLETSIQSLRKAIAKTNRTCREQFRDAFDRVDAAFRAGYPRLVGGGSAHLSLTDDEDLLEAGVEIFVQPPGKRLQHLDLLSGGEKAMTAVALLLALFQVRPSPFCVLDEVDAPLDEANGLRFNDLLRELAATSQLLVITHNKKTMECADALYGVTMPQPGVSQLVTVKLPA